MIAVLAVACGGVAALPFVHLARREVISLRVRGLAHPRLARTGPFARVRVEVARWPGVGALRRVAGEPRRRRARRAQEAALRRELPMVIDLVGVAVSAGCTPVHAVDHAVSYGPSRTAAELRRVQQACARGRAFDEALRDLGSSVSMLRPLADALRTSFRLGTPAAPALARLASEVRADVRRRAEARARTVPVRLCFPLVICVLPAFGLLTVVPVVLAGLHP